MVTAKKDPVIPKARPKVPLRLHATCPDGHEVETEAPAGRNTLKLVCPAEGCTHQVVARRVEGQSPRAREQQAANPETRTPGLRKVRWTRDDPPAFDDLEPETEDGDGGGDDGGGDTGVQNDHPAGPETPDVTGERPAAVEQLATTRRRRRIRRGRVVDHRLYPGIY